jgi:citrate lyase subunit beta/citryl-CoA lyase
MLAKAPTTGADEVVIDLEDAVAVDDKAGARTAVLDALAAWRSEGGAVAVRVNAPRSPWCHLELIALAGLRDLPHSVVVPKVESAGDVAFVDRLLAGAEAASGRRSPLRIQALIETARGLARVDEIAQASERMEGLILGYADLATSLGSDRRLDAWLPAQHAVVVAARAAGLRAIDGPYLRIEADARFEAAALRAREMGFDGKWAIHPGQVHPLNATFTPSAAQVERARAVIAALDDADEGAIAFDGQMLDEALRVQAVRVLARAGEEMSER